MSKFDESSQKWEQEREEHAIFGAFIKIFPAFADEKITEWSLSKCDPPDVICTTTSGRRVGVEISQWAREGEMKAGKLREEKERKLLDAVGVPQPVNMSKNFWLAVFFPRAKVNIRPSDHPMFRQSLDRLFEHVDATWPTEHRGRYNSADLNRFPPLDKYLEQVQFVAGTPLSSDVDRIVPVVPTDSFDDRTMADPLLEQLSKKKIQCRALKADCDELHLLIAYDQALPYCSPIETPRRSVGETAKKQQPRSRLIVVRSVVHSCSLASNPVSKFTDFCDNRRAEYPASLRLCKFDPLFHLQPGRPASRLALNRDPFLAVSTARFIPCRPSATLSTEGRYVTYMRIASSLPNGRNSIAYSLSAVMSLRVWALSSTASHSRRVGV